MPVATSPSAMPLTSSGCSLQNSAIWSKVREVFSTSHTAVAFGISGASLIGTCSLWSFGRTAPVAARMRRSLKIQNSGGRLLYRRRKANLQSSGQASTSARSQKTARRAGAVHAVGMKSAWNLAPPWQVRLYRNKESPFDEPAFCAAVALAFLPMMGPAPAEARGCLKGAVVGGVAGHYAGHHGVIGAIGGCIVGRHMANEKDKEQQGAAAQNPH